MEALNGSTVVLPCTYSSCFGIKNLYFNWQFNDNGTMKKVSLQVMLVSCRSLWIPDSLLVSSGVWVGDRVGEGDAQCENHAKARRVCGQQRQPQRLHPAVEHHLWGWRQLHVFRDQPQREGQEPQRHVWAHRGGRAWVVESREGPIWLGLPRHTTINHNNQTFDPNHSNQTTMKTIWTSQWRVWELGFNKDLPWSPRGWNRSGPNTEPWVDPVEDRQELSVADSGLLLRKVGGGGGCFSLIRISVMPVLKAEPWSHNREKIRSAETRLIQIYPWTVMSLRSGCGRLCWTGLTELGSRGFVGWILLFWWGSETKDISLNARIPNFIHWNCWGSEQRSSLCCFDLNWRKFRGFLNHLLRERDGCLSLLLQ